MDMRTAQLGRLLICWRMSSDGVWTENGRVIKAQVKRIRDGDIKGIRVILLGSCAWFGWV